MVAVAGLSALPAMAPAAPTPERVMGTIEATDAGSVTVRTIDGTAATRVLTKDTKVVAAVGSSLDAITPNAYVGTATEGDDPPLAL